MSSSTNHGLTFGLLEEELCKKDVCLSAYFMNGEWAILVLNVKYGIVLKQFTCTTLLFALGEALKYVDEYVDVLDPVLP